MLYDFRYCQTIVIAKVKILLILKKHWWHDCQLVKWLSNTDAPWIAGTAMLFPAPVHSDMLWFISDHWVHHGTPWYLSSEPLCQTSGPVSSYLCLCVDRTEECLQCKHDAGEILYCGFLECFYFWQVLTWQTLPSGHSKFENLLKIPSRLFLLSWRGLQEVLNFLCAHWVLTNYTE